MERHESKNGRGQERMKCSPASWCNVCSNGGYCGWNKKGEVKGICRVTIKDVEFMKRAEKEGIDILELWEREKGEVKKE